MPVKIAFALLGAYLLCRLLLRLRHILLDLFMDAVGHVYAHHEESFLVVFAVAAWVVLLTLVGSMIYFVMLVDGLVRTWLPTGG